MGQPFTLDRFQKEAIQHVANDHSVIVSAPTGAGKTVIAEHIIEDCISRNKGVIYTAPIKALSNQKFRDFSQKYPEHTGILTGDVSINRNASILIMTTEIFRNAILVDPDEFAHREWVIFDEIHYLDDPERGTVWEEAIILLPPHMKMLALSATLPNLDEFVAWLKKVHNPPLACVVEKTRPVPLHFFFHCNNEFFSDLKELKRSKLLKTAFKRRPHHTEPQFAKPNKLSTLIDSLKHERATPCIYFCFSRRRCEDLAQEIYSANLLNEEEQQKITALFDELLEKFNLSSSPHINFLYPLIKQGIAYHHAGLLPTLKEIIERLFTSGLIKLIFTTETFALGINMPARTVVFDTLWKFYGRYHAYLKVRDFYQMAGRAGRRGIDEEGFVISRVNPHQIDFTSLKQILYGPYEPIRSQFNSCYATILNLYKIFGENIYNIYPQSFHFHQAPQWQKKQARSFLKRKMTLLRELDYLRDKELTWKADLASKVYSFELQIGELFAGGFLDTLDEERLFTVITSLVYEPRKGERKPKLTKQVKSLAKEMNKVLKKIHRRERQFRIRPLSKNCFFHLSDACQRWFHGEAFASIANTCSIDEGEIVRYFRMSIQVLREMTSAQTISEELKAKIKRCLRQVNRDIVDAEKQLRQML